MAKKKKTDGLVNKKQAVAIIKSFENWMSKHSNVFTVKSNWYAGVTNNPTVRKSQHSNQKKFVLYFKSLETDNVETSTYVEDELHNLGLLCERGGGYKNTSVFVYIFKLKPTIFHNLNS